MPGVFADIAGLDLAAHEQAGQEDIGADLGFQSAAADGLPETVELDLALRNGGTSQAASAVTAAITCDDPYITISDGTGSFGTISPGQSAWGQDQFLFTVSPECPDGYTNTLYVDISDNNGATWNGALEMPVEAPAFSILDLRVEDGDQPHPCCKFLTSCSSWRGRFQPLLRCRQKSGHQ